MIFKQILVNNVFFFSAEMKYSQQTLFVIPKDNNWVLMIKTLLLFSVFMCHNKNGAHALQGEHILYEPIIETGST